ncbi:MAG: iron-sulfur cluster assembly accessory protein [Verrucomicrobiae bacterium]|nr:iron-sulfur cluster assembly accessory protein [Verrucomicrobiae bacterium]
MVVLTEAAARQVASMLAQEAGATARPLRVYVEAGGCSGMQYGMQFDELRDGDWVSEQHGVKVVVDPFSANYIRGALVDFSDALTGGGFKINNPNAHSTCGCGRSFHS